MNVEINQYSGVHARFTNIAFCKGINDDYMPYSDSYSENGKSPSIASWNEGDTITESIALLE